MPGADGYWIDFETMTARLDDEMWPVTKLVNARGDIVTNPDDAAGFQAGKDDHWFWCRIYRREEAA